MTRTSLAIVVGLAVLAVTTTGCRTYEITQFDYFAAGSFHPGSHSRAAIIRRPGDKNKLILEAFQVELMKRGMEVVEREKFAKLVNEQMLVRGELTNLSDREKAMRVGKMLNVDVVFYADALLNESRYEYNRPLFRKARAAVLEARANVSGVVQGVGEFEIHAYHNVGVTVRAIEAKSGEIIWVGYRMLAVCEKVTEKSPTALTNFATVKKLCGMVLDDFFRGASGSATAEG